MPEGRAGFWNAPNLLTLSRLALTPFVIAATIQGRHALSLALFLGAAFTDYLDGALARRLGIATAAGAYLDPIADKCLLSGIFVALGAARSIPLWVVAIVLGRDALILAGAAIVWLFTPVRRFPPSAWGKFSTFVQIATVVTWMARNALGTAALATAADMMLWPCVAFTVWSGLDYVRRGIRIARTH